MLRNLGAIGALAVTFLIPVFGMLWGRLFLSEPITGQMLAGTAIILAGTAMTTELDKLARARKPPRQL